MQLLRFILCDKGFPAENQPLGVEARILFMDTCMFLQLKDLSFSRIVDQGFILCDEGFPAEN